MDKETIIKKLKEEFPDKPVLDLTLEVICETEPTKDHPSWSEAIAYIKKSAPHYHNKITETYTVQEGSLTIVLDKKEHVLKEGDKMTVYPPSVHWAYGDWARVKVFTEHGWTPEDHFLVE